METNKLTKRLMAEGWTKEQTPPGCHPWNRFYGGWTYDYRSRLGVVFETPCGLLLKRGEVSHSGSMSYMGIEWTEENDNVTIICPYYDRTELCQLNDPVLEEHASAGCHYENLRYCAIHETDKPYSYERSAKRVRDLASEEEDRLWREFSERHNGRVCRHQCRYNRKTKTWTAGYTPEQCALMGCSYCVVLQQEIDRAKKGNVFYDLKITRTIKGEGLFPEHEETVITKGKKLLNKTVPMQICEAIAKFGVHDAKERLALNCHWDLYFNPGMKIEFLNFRAEKKVGRDLLQDLEDVANGITVFHDADQEKESAEAKRKRREMALQKKLTAMERKILENGLDAFSGYQIERFEKFLGEERCSELDAQYREKRAAQQMSLF